MISKEKFSNVYIFEFLDKRLEVTSLHVKVCHHSIGHTSALTSMLHVRMKQYTDRSNDFIEKYHQPCIYV